MQTVKGIIKRYIDTYKDYRLTVFDINKIPVDDFELEVKQHRMNVDEQAGVVTIPQKRDYDKNGQLVELPSGSFFEILSRFRLFVIQNKHYPFMDGDHDEIALRKWYREIGHGLVPITDEQKILFDNLSVEFAEMPKHRNQLIKDVDIQ